MLPETANTLVAIFHKVFKLGHLWIEIETDNVIALFHGHRNLQLHASFAFGKAFWRTCRNRGTGRTVVARTSRADFVFHLPVFLRIAQFMENRNRRRSARQHGQPRHAQEFHAAFLKAPARLNLHKLAQNSVAGASGLPLSPILVVPEMPGAFIGDRHVKSVRVVYRHITTLVVVVVPAATEYTTLPDMPVAVFEKILASERFDRLLACPAELYRFLC